MSDEPEARNNAPKTRGRPFEPGLPAATLEVQFGKLFRREFTAKPANSMPRWITVETEHGPVRAITFVMNRHSRAYVGRLSPDKIADALSKACGHWGSGAEYLRNTGQHLEARGIHDRNLWRLQSLVAEKINGASRSDPM